MKPKHTYKILHIPTGNFIIVTPGYLISRKISDKLLMEYISTGNGLEGCPRLIYGFFLGKEYLWDKASTRSVELVSHKKEILEKIMELKNFKYCILMDIYKEVKEVPNRENFNRLEFEIIEV